MIDWEDRLARTLVRSLQERADDWLIGDFRAVNPYMRFVIWHANKEFGLRIMRYPDGRSYNWATDVVAMKYGSDKVPWRIALYAAVLEARKTRGFHGKHITLEGQEIFIC